MRVRGLLLAGLTLLLLLAPAVAPALAAASNDKCSLVFIILGDPGCPHCRRTNATLNELYPGCVVFANIAANATAARLYRGLWDTVVKWPGYAVPFIVVLREGKPVAFIVGERPADWWKSLAENLTKRPPASGLLCISGCRELPRDVYEEALRVYRSGGVRVRVAYAWGLPMELVESVFGSYRGGSLPQDVLREALRVLKAGNATLRGYVLACGRLPILVMFTARTPHLLVEANTTVNIDFQALSIASNLATARPPKGAGAYIALVDMRKGRPVMGVRVLPSNHTLAATLQRLCQGSRARMPLHTLLASLIGLAAVDSVNPCFIALYTALVATAAAMSTALAVAAGLSISLGVYTGYYLLGLGLSQALELIGRPLRLIFVLAMLLLAFRGYAEAFRRGGEHECRICRIVETRRISLPILYLLGLIASWTLLPCTAGPYLVAVTLMEGYPLETRLALLAVYNVVFIAPLLAVLLGATRIAARYERLAPKMQLVASTILLGFAVLLLLEEAGLIPPVV